MVPECSPSYLVVIQTLESDVVKNSLGPQDLNSVKPIAPLTIVSRENNVNILVNV